MDSKMTAWSVRRKVIYEVSRMQGVGDFCLKERQNHVPGLKK